MVTRGQYSYIPLAVTLPLVVSSERSPGLWGRASMFAGTADDCDTGVTIIGWSGVLLKRSTPGDWDEGRNIDLHLSK